MRRAAKVDDNHGDIVRTLRAVGCSVLDLSRVGGGCPDLLVCRGGNNVLIEVKRPKAKGQQAGKHTKKQEEFMAAWRGTVYTVYTPEEALRAVGVQS